MDHKRWREFTRRAIPGTKVRCITGKAWVQTWRDGADPRSYPCFGGLEGEKYEGVLFPFSDFHGPSKCDGRETIIVDVHPFNNFDTNNRGLIHPRYHEIQYFIAGRWLTFDEVMALPAVLE